MKFNATPTVHLNGTSREELMRQLIEAADALRVAQKKLAEASPNNRDYYVQEANGSYSATGSYSAALNEHEHLYQMLSEVLEQVEARAMRIDQAH